MHSHVVEDFHSEKWSDKSFPHGEVLRCSHLFHFSELWPSRAGLIRDDSIRSPRTHQQSAPGLDPLCTVHQSTGIFPLNYWRPQIWMLFLLLTLCTAPSLHHLETPAPAKHFYTQNKAFNPLVIKYIFQLVLNVLIVSCLSHKRSKYANKWCFENQIHDLFNILSNGS